MTPKFFFLQRYVPLIVWIIVLATLLFIPFKILSYGFIPPGDARKHLAKAFTEKLDSQIVVLRPGFTMDHNWGWEWFLRRVRQTTDWDIEKLTVFAVITLMLAIFLSALPWLRRPEAWLAAWLVELVALNDLIMRIAQIRPLLITEGILVTLLFLWSRNNSSIPSLAKIIVTAIGFSLSVWVHGAWYLWVFLLAAFFMARRWRDGFYLTGCWIVGVFCGAALTGSPFHFLAEEVKMAWLVSRENVPQWVLVGEFTPSDGEYATLILLAIVFLWRKQRGKSTSALLDAPVFWLIVISWILGLKADRCWADWGIPAALVWLAMQFDEVSLEFCEATSPKRLLFCGLVAAPLFLLSTNDYNQRYSQTAGQQFIGAKDPSLQGWLPDSGGIFYCAQMGFYYDTFYKNPTADWRYILGYEPAIMPEDDLKILRAIQLSHGALEAYEPWIKKMRPIDRLVIYGSEQPALPQLEWHEAVRGIWIGKLPK